jgi:hypothetical protein
VRERERDSLMLKLMDDCRFLLQCEAINVKGFAILFSKIADSSLNESERENFIRMSGMSLIFRSIVARVTLRNTFCSLASAVDMCIIEWTIDHSILFHYSSTGVVSTYGTLAVTSA